MPAGAKQHCRVWRRDRRVFQSDQNPGMGAAIGELDFAGGSLDMGGPGLFLDLFRPLTQLLGLDGQKIAAGVDADIVQLGGLTAQLLGGFHVALETPLIGGILFFQHRPCVAIGQPEQRRIFRPQEQRAPGDIVEKGAVMADDDDSRIARQFTEPVFQHIDLFEVEMVGRLVEQQHIRLGDPRPRQHGKPLPAAAQFFQAALPERLRHQHGVENNVGAPALAVDRIRRQGGKHGVPHRPFHKRQG